jgi:hypothetical protein
MRPDVFNQRDMNSAMDYNPPVAIDNSYARMRQSVERISRVLGLQNPIEPGFAKNDPAKRNNSSNSGVPTVNHETPVLNRQTIDLSNRNHTLNESLN